MPATLYKIWAIGAPVGIGAMGSIHVGVAGVAKPPHPTLPLAVAAELICGNLARAILLPVPPSFLIENGGTKYHVSLNFNLAGQGLPPADPATVVASHPALAWGIVLFDIWVVNPDRHAGNLAFDQTSYKIQIFDHSHAFCPTADPQAHLQGQANQLGIGGHCLAMEIVSDVGFADWLNRIAEVPDFYIREVVQSAVEAGLPANQVDFCHNFLIDRRSRLRELVKAHALAFPKFPEAANL